MSFCISKFTPKQERSGYGFDASQLQSHRSLFLCIDLKVFSASRPLKSSKFNVNFAQLRLSTRSTEDIVLAGNRSAHLQVDYWPAGVCLRLAVSTAVFGLSIECRHKVSACRHQGHARRVSHKKIVYEEDCRPFFCDVVFTSEFCYRTYRVGKQNVLSLHCMYL